MADRILGIEGNVVSTSHDEPPIRIAGVAGKGPLTTLHVACQWYRAWVTRNIDLTIAETCLGTCLSPCIILEVILETIHEVRACL